MEWYEEKGLMMNGGVSLPFYPTGGGLRITVAGGEVAPELPQGYHYTVKCSIRDEIAKKAYLSVNDSETGETVSKPKKYKHFGEEIVSVEIINPPMQKLPPEAETETDSAGNQYRDGVGIDEF